MIGIIQHFNENAQNLRINFQIAKSKITLLRDHSVMSTILYVDI